MWEIVWLVIIGVVMFGPERIPELSRKAARVVWYLRNVANNAQDQLRSELGPDYADFQLTDLHPKTLVRKHIIDAYQEDIDDIRSDLSGIRSELDEVTAESRNFVDIDNGTTYNWPRRNTVDRTTPAPFDTEAT